MENIIIISTISDRSENRHDTLVHYLSPILFSTDQFPCPFGSVEEVKSEKNIVNTGTSQHLHMK